LRWKMLKRRLQATEAGPAAPDLATFQSLIWLGNERGLLRTDCNHSCEAAKAEAVFAIAPDFLQYARVLLAHWQAQACAS
jgi:hypothetical protein